MTAIESQLVFSEEELLSSHDYESVQEACGRVLHGGFLADGSYQPPRSLGRDRALRAWTAALEAAGGSLFAADASLLEGVRYPNEAQHRSLLEDGVGRVFWNALTITGKIEARGRLLADVAFAELQPEIVEDVSAMAIGHLNQGLLKAHGWDEGGESDEAPGAHDVMWFMARDLAFGEGAFADAEPPERIGRMEAPERVMPEVSPGVEGLLSLLMNLLIIEFRAEIFFALAQNVLRTPGLFGEREAGALEAAELIERIRIDEEVHIRSLRLYLGELRTVTFRRCDVAAEGADGAGAGTVSGAELIDRLWGDLVHWATVEQPALMAEREKVAIRDVVLAEPGGAEALPRFESLAD